MRRPEKFEKIFHQVLTLLINQGEDFVAFSQQLNFNNVCLGVEGTSSRMHLFHFMQTNLSFSDVTQSRFWIKLIHMYFNHSVLVILSFAGELPDPNQDAIMSRCNVCSEKAYVNPCAHCDKKCCEDCREAHCDILKREISRVNNQVKRGWHRLEDCVQQVS